MTWRREMLGRPTMWYGFLVGLRMDECDSGVQRTENLRRQNMSLRRERSGLAQPDH